MLILPIGVDNPLRRRPLVNHFLIILNFVIFAHTLSVMAQAERRLIIRERERGRTGVAVLDRFALHTPPSRLFRPHQLLSYAFLHQGWFHILGNMLFLWVFGNALNDRLGHFGYLVFYLCAAGIAGLGQILASNPGQLCVGASGAVCAVMGAYLVLFPLTDVKVFYWVFIAAGVRYFRSLVFLAIWVVFDLMMALSGGDTAVAYPAHLTGYAMGIAIMLAALHFGLLRREGIDLISWARGVMPDGTPWRSGLMSIHSAQDTPGHFPGVAEPPGESEFAGPNIHDLNDVGRLIEANLLHAVGVGDMGAALGLYERHRILRPNAVLPLRALVAIGNWFLRAGRYRDAVETWRRAALQHPGNHLTPAILFSIGMVLSHHLGEQALALEYLAAALPGLNDPDRSRMARREVTRLRRTLGQ